MLKSESLEWMKQFNVLLVVKELLKADSSISGEVYQAIGQEIIEILDKEDEIKNPACECLEIMSEDILDGDCTPLFEKLEACLRESDDVECSAVSIFNLII